MAYTEPYLRSKTPGDGALTAAQRGLQHRDDGAIAHSSHRKTAAQPETYDAGTDDTSFVQTALGTGRPVFLRRFYHVTNIYLPRLKGGVVVQGNGSLSGLVGSDFNSPAVLQTWNPNDPDSLR